ncbi:uncharacterized protein LOC132271179 [Cornus florida]|uniref:uncharacterized protein LOC132271179 n=1 Tax=Cornus florida TaxID=4283 RepID=UPI00289E8CA0|nr:uncharacterized protein LOC132271179 [Cornus florida]XP_059628458.1 uncharacterized protein LOC132271179 [Cornus florida]XP_059628459.1 uncharacterized protein LOC132271179 [Cornus florida]
MSPQSSGLFYERRELIGNGWSWQKEDSCCHNVEAPTPVPEVGEDNVEPLMPVLEGNKDNVEAHSGRSSRLILHRAVATEMVRQREMALPTQKGWPWQQKMKFENLKKKINIFIAYLV